MTHPAIPQRAQHGRVRIALHGIHRDTWERGQECRGVLRQRGGTQAMQRLGGAERRHQIINARQCRRAIERAAERRDGGTRTKLAHQRESLTIALTMASTPHRVSAVWINRNEKHGNA